MEINKLVRQYCPNIGFIRKYFNKKKLQIVDKYKYILDENRNKTKEEILEECLKKWPDQYKKIKNDSLKTCLRYQHLIRNADRNVVVSDILFCYFVYGFLPEEYFYYSLEDTDDFYKQSFISDRDRNKIVYSLNDIIDMGIFFDKWKTYDFYKKYYHREAVLIKNQNDKLIFEQFILKYPRFVKKKVNLSRGESVELIDTHNVDLANIFKKICQDAPCILEEVIVQEKPLSKLNESSVNTVRCISFQKEGETLIPFCFLKIGQKGSFVDNGGAGGILVGIDTESGILDTDGIDENCKIYKKHPDSGICFKGYQLPDWKNAKLLVKELMKEMQSMKYIGWDLAYTDKGWVVVEGNSSGQFIGPQLVYQRGIKKDILDCIY